ncbi:MAG: ABC transporter substrate-binding protein [Bacteroidota bacterium]|nr:ABC transporter substrate-binding protein [Bacteroidota bacterium]
MILVQSLRQQLNGNNLARIFSIFLMLFVFQSCILQKQDVEQAKLESQFIKQKNNIDTIKTSLIEKKKIDTIDIIYPDVLKESYNIAIVLPLLLSDIYDKEYNQEVISTAALDFYRGVLLALEDSISKLDININIFVLDNEKSKFKTDTGIIQQLEEIDADLIIGPFLIKNIKVISEFSLKNKIPFVSLFSTIDSCIVKNPYFISLEPTEVRFIENVSRYIEKNFKNHNIILITTSTGKTDFALKTVLNTIDTSVFSSFKTSTVNVNNISWSTASYIKLLNDEKNVLLFLIDNEVMVNSIITNLVAVENEIVTIVPFKWLYFNSVDISYLEKINTYFVSKPIMEYSDSSVIVFTKRYRKKFKTEATKYSYTAYLTMLYFTNQLVSHGKYFPKEAFVKNPEQKSRFFYFQRTNNSQGFDNSNVKFYTFNKHKLEEAKPLIVRDIDEDKK